MNKLQDAILGYESLSQETQIEVLTRFIFECTLEGRGTYIPGETGLAQPERLRMLNELIHRVSSQLLALLHDDPERYPDDVLVKLILEESECAPWKAWQRSQPVIAIA